MLTSEEQVAAVQRMQSHIEDHLGDRITLTGLARCAKYSPWYAARVFKEQTGKSPFEYIRLRRMSSAARNLSASSDKIIEVAFDFVFDSHEGFTRAFSRQFGISPREYRKTKPPVVMFMPERMRHYYTNQPHKGGQAVSAEKTNNTVFVQVIERPARKLILKRGKNATHYFEYCEEVGGEVWVQLGSVKDAIHEPMGLWLPETFRSPGTSTYVQGVEVDQNYTGPIPNGLEIIDLPACMMMVFQGQPFDDEDFEQAISSLWDEIKNYRPETFGFAWDDEAGPRFQLEPVGYRGYIEGRPVRTLNG
jgi:AraC family transcriptional regulator